MRHRLAGRARSGCFAAGRSVRTRCVPLSPVRESSWGRSDQPTSLPSARCRFDPTGSGSEEPLDREDLEETACPFGENRRAGEVYRGLWRYLGRSASQIRVMSRGATRRLGEVGRPTSGCRRRPRQARPPRAGTQGAAHARRDHRGGPSPSAVALAHDCSAWSWLLVTAADGADRRSSAP